VKSRNLARRLERLEADILPAEEKLKDSVTATAGPLL
jgi:hypothetical protein